jgi:hypothetical protein
MLGDVQQYRKSKMKKRTTDPFQVFCAHKRNEMTCLHPHDSVGVITSRLAAIWRGMSADQKMEYAELAKQFDLSSNVQTSQTETLIQSKIDISSIALPFIAVLQRNGCSTAPHEASLTSLDLIVQGKLTRPQPFQ